MHSGSISRGFPAARVSAQLALSCKCVHGVFLSGAGFPTSALPSRDAVFAVFAAVGMTDFNYGEMTELDAKLESLNVPHFLRRFEGPHERAPREVWEEAFGWVALQAMKENRRARDADLIAAELARARARAAKLGTPGNAYFAYENARQLAATFAGLAATREFRERAAALEKDPGVRAGKKREEQEIQEQWRLEGEVTAVAQVRTEGSPGGTGEMDWMDQVRGSVQRLRESTEREKKPEKRRVLERARAGVFARLIETGESAMETKDLRRARMYLELAVEARPDRPWPHISLARCLVLMGDKKEALRSLKRARDAGLTAQALANLPERIAEFAPITNDPEYQKLLADSPVKPAS